ncbi:5-oxoprolinase subunit PxpA [Sphingomonas sp. IC-11]|uniref:LamB/YcsF family protein n=1 Tax=Sphingomonas sp. IC-11 TaxID=2898528 RepID=UPI001E61A981|nr:5-oxoprolinase subunit PxpA [Sphingomonas sp. IC-11]
MVTIDLNADLGEGFGPWAMGDDAAMFALVTSANVACGGHASDPETMFRTLCLARDNDVVVGAHPSYPDLAGFGRRRLPVSEAEVERFVAAQIGSILAVASLAGHPVRYVKPHGALANVAAAERAVAEAIVRSVQAVDRRLAILAISGTELESAASRAGLRVFSEIYADRAYTAAGQLVPRSAPGAVIHDADAAAARLLAFFDGGAMPTIDGASIKLAADSICVHGDNPAAVAMAARVRSALEGQGLKIAPFLDRA